MSRKGAGSFERWPDWERCGAMASRRMLSGTWSESAARERRTCAKLCHDSGGELEQIQFLLGHASVQTTERYLGCKQNLGSPVNDRFNLRAKVQACAKDPEI